MLYKGLVDKADLLDFSQNFSVGRNYLGSTLFPDVKTQYMDAEYYRLCKNGNLPLVAEVHAFDTEAKIGSRIALDKVQTEKLLIKEKVNQTEELRKTLRGSVADADTVLNYVFDDFARTAEKVVSRAELAKMEAIATGKMTLNENGAQLEIDYGIPMENFVESSWDSAADILGDIRMWRNLALEGGTTPNLAITTEGVVTAMRQNEQIQKAIFGASGTGILPTLDQINTLLQSQTGIRIQTNEARYGTLNADGTISQNRFFPADTFVMVATGADGTLGSGLWGVTPEEELQGGAFDVKRQQQFVTLTQWTTPDPTAVWTKASGLFIPVLPNPYGHIIATLSGTQG